MAGRFTNPFPQFLDATPEVRSGAKLFFYAAGTSTKLDTYSDRLLASPNTNPVVLNSAGYPSTDIYLQDLDYKVVLAPATDTDPPANPIWTADYVNARDSKLIVKTITGSGSPNGVVAGTAGSSGVLPDEYWDYTNSVLYFCTATGTASTAVWTAINSGAAIPSVPPPQGRLTLTSATPVLASGVTAATTVYYTPYAGNLIPIYNGSTMIPTTFSELSLSLVSNHALNTIYDVFVFSNSGVLTLVTGPAWSVSSSGSGARGSGAGTTQLTRVGGLWTNAVSMTARNGSTTYTVGANLATYVGSIIIDGTAGQVTCNIGFGASRKWGVWNAYNRVQITLEAGTSPAGYSYATSSYRVYANDTTNTLSIFQGLAEEPAVISTSAYLTCSGVANATLSTGTIGIGYNSTSSPTGKLGTFSLTNSTGSGTIPIQYTLEASYRAAPLLGAVNVYPLQNGGGTTATTVWNDSSSNSPLIAIYRG
jgi:hypothetical protein